MLLLPQASSAPRQGGSPAFAPSQASRALGLVQHHLNLQWSPEEISGFLAKTTDHRISHEAIYLSIYENKLQGGTLYLNLCQGHRKRRLRLNRKDLQGRIKHRVSIDERPLSSTKKNLGRPVLVTIADRMSKYPFIGLAASKQADDVGGVIHQLLKNYKGLLKTGTYDNGKEFAFR